VALNTTPPSVQYIILGSVSTREHDWPYYQRKRVSIYLIFQSLQNIKIKKVWG